jgi:hypothetical protein
MMLRKLKNRLDRLSDWMEVGQLAGVGNLEHFLQEILSSLGDVALETGVAYF